MHFHLKKRVHYYHIKNVFMKKTFRFIVMLVMLAAYSSPQALAATHTVKKSISFAVEYNDNIAESSENQKTDFITHIKPAISYKGEGGRITVDGSYKGDYQLYAKGKGMRDFSHDLNVAVMTEVVENLFYVNMVEDLEPVYRDLTRGELEEGDNMLDTVNRNKFDFSPYFSLQPTDRTSVSFGYRFSDTRYSKSGYGSRKNFFPSDSEYAFNHNRSQQHAAFLQLVHEISERCLVYAGVDITRWQGNSADFDDSSNFYRYQGYLGGMYEFSDELSASVRVGPAYTVTDDGSKELNPFIEAELKYSIGNTDFGLAYNTTYEDDPKLGNSTRVSRYSFSIDKTFERATLNLGVSRNSFEDEGGARKNNRSTITPYFGFRYELSERASFFARYGFTLYEDKGSGQNRYQATHGFKYELDEDCWLTLSYNIRRVEPIDEKALWVNRVVLEFAYAF